MFEDPTSSSPSISNFTLSGMLPIECSYDPIAACITAPPLSSETPRPYRRPFRTVGSKFYAATGLFLWKE